MASSGPGFEGLMMPGPAGAQGPGSCSGSSLVSGDGEAQSLATAPRSWPSNSSMTCAVSVQKLGKKASMQPHEVLPVSSLRWLMRN